MRLVGLAAVAALLLGAVTGCGLTGDSAGDADAPAGRATPSVTVAAPSSPVPTESASPSPKRAAKRPGEVSGIESGGLNVRYLDKNGKLRELKVEDFPR